MADLPKAAVVRLAKKAGAERVGEDAADALVAKAEAYIEEIAKTIQKLIIIDKGTLCFFDTLQAVEEKAYSVSGLKNDVEIAVRNLNVIGEDCVGGLMTAYIFDKPLAESSLEIHPLSLQDFFIQLVGHKGGVRK